MCASLSEFTFYDLVGDTSGGAGQLYFLKYYWLFSLFNTLPFLQVSKSIVNMMFYSLFIHVPCLFCVNSFVSNSFIITTFKNNDNFKSNTFLFCFFLAKNQASVSPSWICHKEN